MQEETIQKNTVMRGKTSYVEIEGKNRTYETIICKLKSYKYKGISKENSDTLLDFLQDMLKGIYTPLRATKGGRSYKRLVKLFYCLKSIIKFYDNKNILQISEKELHKIFDDLNSNKIVRKDGKPYSDKRDFKKDMATFWHWHMVKIYKTQDHKIEDITEYINTPKESRPKFAYFTFEELRQDVLNLTSSEDLKAIMLVLFDCGARPSEFFNLRRKDVHKTESEKLQLEISEDISKTYGRKVTLAISSQTLLKYLERKQFKKNDLIFLPLKNALKVFLIRIREDKKIQKIMAQTGTEKISTYDFRHSSACYYINIYKENLGARMKYRYGWRKETEIEYYTNFLGKQDVITEDELLNPQDKSQLQKDNEDLKKQVSNVENKMQDLQEQMIAMLKAYEIQLSQNPNINPVESLEDIKKIKEGMILRGEIK